MDFTRAANNKNRRLLFISTELGTVSSVSEALGTKQCCSCWDAARQCIAKRQVTVPWQHFPLHTNMPIQQTSQLAVLIPVLGTARCHTGEAVHKHAGGPEGFICFLHAAERALKGSCWLCMFGAMEKKIDVGTADGFSVQSNPGCLPVKTELIYS